MQPDNHPAAPLPEAAAVPLYSVLAVQMFSALFSAVAGGFLMAQNLKDVGQPGAARKALGGSVAYTLALMGGLALLPDSVRVGSWVPVVAGLAGAGGLNAYAARFITDRSRHPAKKTGKPLLICLAVFVPLIALLIYALVVVGRE